MIKIIQDQTLNILSVKEGSGVGECLFECGDDRLDGFEAAGDAQQVRRNAAALGPLEFVIVGE